MEKFTASNGNRVYAEDDDTIRVESPTYPDYVGPVTGVVTALREFFLHERDTELGRWRWPKDRNYVVYFRSHGDRFVHVYHEPSTGLYTAHRDEENETSFGYSDAAQAYFAAHPVPKPLPAEPHTAWVDKYGTDIWWVDGLGVLRCCASPSSDPLKYAPFTQLVKEQVNG